MNGIKELIHEIHRRSLWQVTGIFLAASWGVLQVVEVLTQTAGLPDWTPSMALVLLLLGLPVCLATAFVQEGMPGESRSSDAGEAGTTTSEGTAEVVSGESEHDTTALHRASARASTTRRLLTWRNAILGGVGAFALLGFSLIAYFVMWSTGVGPVGNLQAQGFIETGDPVLLADFEDNTDDASLGDVVTEALRVDLATTEAITLVEPASVSGILVLIWVSRPRPESAAPSRTRSSCAVVIAP
ncbi:MAG: hypothetical protein R3304_13135 [Longimicrobiales bacterium]|nr:hypothetical protein [Longimicrobiales bacterium]